MTAQQAYEELGKRIYELSVLGSCGAILGWDERTYMPRGGAGMRAEQLSLLSGMIHEKFTDPKVGELLSTCLQSDLMKDAESPAAVNVRELKREYDKRTKLPKALVEELTRTTTLAQGEWVTARAKRDFKHFEPWLGKVLDLTRQKADAYGYKKEKYDALLDDYEPGGTVEELAGVFKSLREDLVVLLQKIKNAPRKPNAAIVERDYDTNLQRILGESVVQAMGFSFNEGRLDVTTHPFCSGTGIGDTRITTRFNPHRLNDALFGIMHEAGHGLYEMGLDKKTHFGMPMGESVSLGIHESQSRMWENQVGRSKAFWKYFFPQAQRMFRASLGDVNLDDFYAAINDVAPSYIRVEADEATYNLHILLRFELEQAMIRGDLKPADVPSEWNRRFKEYIGIAVDHDANGCLQDVHWSAGLIGYFPTYSLGNLYSAQFFATAKKAIPDLEARFERGDLLTLREWLRENIHRHGRRYHAGKLCEKITGKPLSHKPLVEYMTAKFGEIYGF